MHSNADLSNYNPHNRSKLRLHHVEVMGVSKYALLKMFSDIEKFGGKVVYETYEATFKTVFKEVIIDAEEWLLDQIEVKMMALSRPVR